MLKSLSPDEAIVLRLMVDGMSNKEISEKLIVPVLMIDNNVQAIFKKLKVRNCFQAAAKAAIAAAKRK